jgi:hypothetical protein
MTLTLYPFRYRDPVTRRWMKARYVAELEVIKARYAEFELTGPPEVGEVTSGSFSPHHTPDDSRREDDQR